MFANNHSAGGVVTLVNKSLSNCDLQADLIPSITSEALDFSVDSIAPSARGRVLRTDCVGGRGHIAHWNIHNFGLTVVAAQDLATAIRKDIEWANADPLKHAVWVVGDWNFVAHCESAISMGQSLLQAEGLHVAAVPLKAHQGLWQPLLDDLTEIANNGFTHFIPATCSYS